MTQESPCAPFLLIADPAYLAPSERVWGTGGWLSPQSRTALDWLCLARGLGWGVDIVSPDMPSLRKQLLPGRQWIVVGCEPEQLTSDAIDVLKAFLAIDPVLLIGTAASAEIPWSRATGVRRQGEPFEGRLLSWQGECAESWTCRKTMHGMKLEVGDEAVTLACLDQAPIIAASSCGRGAIIALGFDPSEARDANGCVTALLRKLLVCASLRPVAWFDLARTVALRMDDPGAAQSVYLASWSYPQLGQDAWKSISDVLSSRNARLSVGYVGGWVDDGDAGRGSLTVGGNAVARVPGRIHPSAEVVYRDIAGHLPGAVHDYAGQFSQLQKTCTLGVVDIELHGYTHMHPDTTAWAAASDRYASVHWFRELGDRADAFLAQQCDHAHPIVEGLGEIQRRFGTRASTLICPGDEWGQSSLEAALNAGVQAVSSYYFAFRFDDRFCWSQHVCAPYLNEPNSSWFDSGLPVIGYFHDAELSIEGPQWLAHWLDEWKSAGASSFISLREVAAAHNSSLSVIRRNDACEITATASSAAFEGVSLPVRFFIPRQVKCSSVTLQGEVALMPLAAKPSEQHAIAVCASPVAAKGNGTAGAGTHRK